MFFSECCIARSADEHLYSKSALFMNGGFTNSVKYDADYIFAYKCVLFLWNVFYVCFW